MIAACPAALVGASFCQASDWCPWSGCLMYLVTAATVPLLFRSSLRLGYKLATSLLLALPLPLPPLPCPIPQLFCEPLTTFFCCWRCLPCWQGSAAGALECAALWGRVGGAYATKVSTLAAVLPLFCWQLSCWLPSLAATIAVDSVVGGWLCLFASPLWWSVFLQDSGQAESVAARSAASTLPLSALPLTTAGEWQQLWRRVSGLLLSPGKSIFFYSPILLLSLVGLPWFLRRHLAWAWQFWASAASIRWAMGFQR